MTLDSTVPEQDEPCDSAPSQWLCDHPAQRTVTPAHLRMGKRKRAYRYRSPTTRRQYLLAEAASAAVAVATVVRTAIAEGRRNATLASIARSLRHRGLSAFEIGRAVRRGDTARCMPPLSPRSAGIADGYTGYPAATGADPPIVTPSCTGAARAMAAKDPAAVDAALRAHLVLLVKRRAAAPPTWCAPRAACGPASSPWTPQTYSA